MALLPFGNPVWDPGFAKGGRGMEKGFGKARAKETVEAKQETQGLSSSNPFKNLYHCSCGPLPLPVSTKHIATYLQAPDLHPEKMKGKHPGFLKCAHWHIPKDRLPTHARHTAYISMHQAPVITATIFHLSTYQRKASDNLDPHTTHIFSTLELNHWKAISWPLQ